MCYQIDVGSNISGVVSVELALNLAADVSLGLPYILLKRRFSISVALWIHILTPVCTVLIYESLSNAFTEPWFAIVV